MLGFFFYLNGGETMANDVGVRSYLAGKGVDNSAIGYDQNSGNVTVNGQNFIKPSLSMAGTTYDNQQNLDSAYGNYQKQQQPQSTVGWSPSNAFGVQQPNQNPLMTNNSPYTFHESATSPVQNQAVAQVPQGNDLASLTKQFTNQTPYENPYAKQISDIMNQVNAARQATQAPIDPYSTPQYAAQQAQQQKLAQQGTRAAQESMGQSGFARSTNLADRAQHIQNDANDYMTTQAVPQIIAQIQAQHQQEYQNAMSQFNPLMQLSQQADNLHQQQQAQLADQVKFLTGQANADRTAAQNLKQQHIDLANTLSQQYGVHVNPTDDPMESYAQVAGLTSVAAQKISADAKQTTFDDAIKAALADNTITQTQASILNQARQAGIAQQNANSSTSNAASSALNAQTNANKQPAQPKQTNTATYISNFNKIYTARNKETGQMEVTNKDQLENAILGLHLTDNQTMELYNYYGIQIPK
jgi:hypothetical protein